MAGFIFRRSLQSLFSILGLLTFVFFLIRLTGSPADVMLPSDTPPALRQQFSERFGLDQPIWIQFIRYVESLVHFDFGMSLRQQRPAMDAVLEAFPTTLKLAVVAMALAVVLALIFGALAAARPGGLFDRLASLISLAGASAPDFWIAIVGVLIFSVTLHVLPTSGTGPFQFWVMPIAVLALRPFGLLVQVVRGTMIGVLSAPYIKTARAKGDPEHIVIFVHALRNAMLPVITVASDLAASLLNGAVIVETVYGWPGVGKLMLDGIEERDFAVVQSIILVTAAAIFLINIGIDILYAVLDPRIRHS